VLAALFYLKMTYFAVGMAMIAVAVIASEPMRGDWRGWTLVFLIGVALPLLPFNWAYLEDLRGAAQAGIVRGDAAFFLNDFAENAPEYAPYVVAIGVAAWPRSCSAGSSTIISCRGSCSSCRSRRSSPPARAW